MLEIFQKGHGMKCFRKYYGDVNRDLNNTKASLFSVFSSPEYHKEKIRARSRFQGQISPENAGFPCLHTSLDPPTHAHIVYLSFHGDLPGFPLAHPSKHRMWVGKGRGPVGRYSAFSAANVPFRPRSMAWVFLDCQGRTLEKGGNGKKILEQTIQNSYCPIISL